MTQMLSSIQTLSTLADCTGWSISK